MRTRIAAYLFTFWAVLTLNFLLPRLLPGDPLLALFEPGTSEFVSDEAIRARLAAYYGLDRPLIAQYVDYLRGAATGDLGWSIALNQPVGELIRTRLPWTLLLTLTSLALASLIGVAAGAESAWARGSWLDRIQVTANTMISNMPVFFVGPILLVALGAKLRWFPLSGAHAPFAKYDSAFAGFADVLWHLILPAAALTLSLIGSKFLLVRNSMVSVLGEDFMFVARAKGLPGQRLKFHHALRNAILPFVQQLAMQAGLAVTGAVFVETTFDYPGMGRLIFNAVGSRDYPLMQGVFLVVAIAVLCANLLADAINARLDPRAGTK